MKAILINLFLLFSWITFGQNDTTSNSLYQKVISLDEQIRNDPSKQTTSFNPEDSTSLPIGIVRPIGNTLYIVCVDSAWFTPDGAFFNVYMAIQPQGADKPIAFAAKGIQFNPKGVSVAGGARLQLVSQQAVRISPKVEVVFKNDGQNFIEFDCNGYKLTGLSLDFIFDSESFVNADEPTDPVKASMQMTASDLNDITYQLQSITPFKLRAAKDFIFEMQNIVIDMSDVSTPSGIPTQYINTATLGGGLPSWTGFYAQNITVKMPEKLSSKNSTTRKEIYAQDMIIDGSGLSGQFGVNNLLADGDMGGAWDFTIDNISVDIAHNTIVAGNMDGGITIPQLDDLQLDYQANMYQTQGDQLLAFNFTVAPSDTIELGSFKSKLNISPCSQINIGTVGNNFIPSAVLSGQWTIDFDKAKFDGIAFQDLHLGTSAPYLTSGTFALVSSSNQKNLMGFSASLTQVGITQTSSGDLAFRVGLGMNFGGSNNVSFGVESVVRVVTDLETGSDSRDRFTFQTFQVDDILIEANTNAFALNGVVSVRNDDPVFGDLFYGSISLKLKNVMNNPILVSAGFGKMPNYKYWFTEASIPTNITVATGLYITSIYGGVQNRVASNFSDQVLLDRVAGNLPPPAQGQAIPFTPDDTQGLVFRAGVGLMGEQEKMFNGEAMLQVVFNPNGGFQSIDFLGQAYMMVTRQQRANPNAKKIFGTVAVGYDHANKVFDANLSAAIYYPSVLTGGLNLQIHIDTSEWYFWLNTPVNRANVNLVNVFNVNAYFMVGTEIMPISPPPSYVTNLVGAGTIGTMDVNALGTGGGFATGMQFNTGFGGEFPKTGKWRGFVQVAVGGGFDIMLLNVQNAHCAGSTDPVGVNGFYAMGQVYAYLDGALGVRKYKDNGDLQNTYNLGSLQVAALLQGKLPKPTFVYGAIGVQANVLGIIDFSFNADVEIGNDCTLVGI